MSDDQKRSGIFIFWLELITAAFVALIVCCSLIPTNILNSNSLLFVLQNVAIGAIVLILFAGIPVGIVGIVKSKKMIKDRIATMVLSVINLSAAAFEFAIICLIFYGVMFLGLSA